MAEQDKILQLTWLGRGSKHNLASTDVSVSVYDTHKGKIDRKDISITFRNDVHKLFGTGFVEVAIWKNRLFFRAADKDHGLKIVQRSSEENGYLRIGTESFVKKLMVFEGNYELKYDDFYEMYYIENENLNK